MSDDPDRSRRESVAEDEPDAFDSLDDPEAEIDDPFAELGEGIGVGGSDASDSDAGGFDAGGSDASDSDAGGSDASGSDADARERSADEPARSSSDEPVRSSSEATPDGETAPGAEGSDSFDAIGRADADREDPFGDASGEWDDEMADLDDAFERMDVDGPAAEDVWESLDADAGTDAFDADAGLGGAASVPGGGDTEHVVSKRTYCQQCPHFSRPPEAACTHEGTTIVEAVGFDEFRVRNCPMISEEDPTFDGDR
jgi:hypothetical protein